MTVYVDDMHTWSMGRFGNMKMSHMIADTNKELHRMAKAIGVARKHFQDKSSSPHYDIAKSKRKLALQNGAIEITVRQCARMCFVRRLEGKLPKPHKADKRWKRIQADLLEKAKEHSEKREFIRGYHELRANPKKPRIRRVRLTQERSNGTTKKRVRLEGDRGAAEQRTVNHTRQPPIHPRPHSRKTRKSPYGFF